MAGDHLTSAQKIFRFFYNCHLPAMYTYSQTADNLYGRPSTGDEVYDRELAESTIYTQLNIWQIATHYTNGVPIGLQKPSEAVEIYTVVRDLINEWVRRIQQDINLVDYPQDQLRVLEEFAKEIWTWAEVHQPRELMSVGISLDLAMANRTRASERFYNKANVAEVAKTDTAVTDAYRANDDAWKQAELEKKAKQAEVINVGGSNMSELMQPIGPSIRQQPLEQNRYQQPVYVPTDEDEDDECTWG